MTFSVILAGGKGERFWPFSTREKPKQLLKIFSDKTMLQETIDRVSDFIPIERTLVITGESLKTQILNSNSPLAEENILTEPNGKNTCLAIGFAAVHLVRRHPDAVMVVLSADHYIKPKERLVEILQKGVELAKRDGSLVTIGIDPTRPETAYGYIELGEKLSETGKIATYTVAKFKEKPTRMVAQQYFVDRTHLWNSGMFIWTAKAILAAIKWHQPEMKKLLENYSHAIDTSGENDARKELFEHAENISIDCGILEEAHNVIVIRGDLLWDDIGSWLALGRINPCDHDNNLSMGKVVQHDSYEVTAVNSSNGIICTLGVSDLVVVKTDSVVLVAHKTRVNDVRELLVRLEDDEELEKYL